MIDEIFLVRNDFINRDAYLNQQSTGGCWCDEIILLATATLLKYEIRILHHTGHVTVLRPNNFSEARSNGIEDQFI